MMKHGMAHFRGLAVVSMILIGSAPVRLGRGQTGRDSADELIRSLVDPIDPMRRADLLDKNGGRRPDVDRAVSNSLVALGPSAIDSLYPILDRIQRRGREAPEASNSRWLLFAYARLRGPDAYPLLKAMSLNPKLRFLGADLDHAVALALDLTSYVSASRVADPFVCCEREEPRQSLDRMILAWFQGNRLGMVEELGPSAQVELDRILTNRTWTELTAKLMNHAPDTNMAVGFRFEHSGDWSLPPEALDQKLENRRRSTNLDHFPARPKLMTLFVDAAGKDCMRREISFVRSWTGPARLRVKYSIDDGDMEGLLRMISQCSLSSVEIR